MDCVDRTELEKFLRGEIEPDRLAALDDHLSGCASCREALNALPARARVIASFGAELIGTADCPDYERLSALVDGSLEPAESRRLLAHVNMCELCRADVERMQALRSQGAVRGIVHVQPGTTRRSAMWIGSFWRKAAALVAAAGAVAVAAFVFLERPTVRSTAPPTPRPAAVVTHAPESVRPKPQPTAKPVVPKPTVVAHEPATPRRSTPAPTPLLRDGPYRLAKTDGRYTLARVDGKSIGTPLEARIAALIGEKIATGRIRPAKPVQVAMNTILVRQQDDYVPPPTAPEPISPVGTVVMSNRPVFRWSAVDLAESYRLVVTDKDGNRMFEGSTDKTGMKLPIALERGRVYLWRVGSGFSSSDSWAMSRAAAFRVISSEDAAAIEQVRRTMPGSHLALGVVYESVGLYAEAAKEYRAVRGANPRSATARRLLPP